MFLAPSAKIAASRSLSDSPGLDLDSPEGKELFAVVVLLAFVLGAAVAVDAVGGDAFSEVPPPLLAGPR
jgi:hypothetical protein